MKERKSAVELVDIILNDLEILRIRQRLDETTATLKNLEKEHKDKAPPGKTIPPKKPPAQ